MSAVTPVRPQPIRLPAAVLSPAWRTSVNVGLSAVLLFRVAAQALVMAGLWGGAAVGVIAADPASLVRPWIQWDAQWQVGIARYGYTGIPDIHAGSHVFSTAAFQPVLSGLTHVVAALGLSTDAAGLVVVSAALGAAAVGLHRLVLLDHGQRAARLGVVLLLVFPTAVFLGAPYAEPLVLAEAVWAFLAVRSGRWFLAGLLVGLATLTKLYALVLVVPVAVEAATVAGEAARERLEAAARVCAGAVLGFAGLVAFYALAFGDPLRFFTAQQQWAGRQLAAPWASLAAAVHPFPALTVADASALLDLACVVLLAAATLFAWRHLRRSYAVLLAVQLAVFVSTTTLVGTSRWTLDAFPLFIAGGVLGARRPWVARTLVAISLPLACLMLWSYSHGGWVG